MKCSQTILVTGATGLIGSALCPALKHRGHRVRTLSRRSGGDFRWDVENNKMDTAAVQKVDAVIHLAGETIAQRWNHAAKARILNSRVAGSRLLVNAILKQKNPPAFISASGISYYGVDRAGLLDEQAGSGSGFLASVTAQWEKAAGPLSDTGIRTVFLRTGIVLSKQGGALAKMLPAFKLGLGGRIGDGRQQMSWVSLPDLVAMYIFAVENESVRGAMNAVAPRPVSNFEWTKVLARILNRPAWLPLPAGMVRVLFGQMGTETVLSNLGVIPAGFKALSFNWKSTTLEQALSEALHL